MSDEKRNETQLLCDIPGLESLVDEITSAASHTSTSSTSTTPTPISTSEPHPTPSAILSPFHRPNAPFLPANSSIACQDPAYTPFLTHFSGRVLSTRGSSIPDATLDVWHTAPNGKYEQQDANQPDFHLRGRFQTDTSGRFSLYCLRPAAYPIPDDGPGGQLLSLLDRKPWRPAHIHVIVEAEGYGALTTQLFDRGWGYLGDDTVFAVKRELVVGFVAREGDPRARWTLEYDFVLSEA